MRDYYPSVLLYGNDDKLLEIFCKSIRFSTHCNYVVVSDNEPICTENYEYLEWVQSNEFQLSKTSQADAVVKLDDSGVEFSNSCDFLTHETSIRENAGCSKKVQHLLNEFIEKDCFNSLLEYIGDLDPYYVAFDILVDYEGETNVIGGVKIANAMGSYDHHVFDPRYLESLDFFIEFGKKIPIKENALLSLKISNCKIKGLSVQANVNKYFSHWEYYRAVGINIPLIIIQNLLRRKIKTYKFVNCSDFVYREDISSPVFVLDFDTIYFDLDETLVWNRKPIIEIVDFLHKQREKGIILNLITRHTYDVSETLNKIGLKVELFKKIIVVKPHELKSSYISGNSILIDNEFPQRLDVRLKSGIPVLDLDQVDFFD